MGGQHSRPEGRDRRDQVDRHGLYVMRPSYQSNVGTQDVHSIGYEYLGYQAASRKYPKETVDPDDDVDHEMNGTMTAEAAE